MLCARCHKNQATVHLTAVVDGREAETVHLCADCAPGVTGIHTLNSSQLGEASLVGKTCECCRREAVSGQTLPSGGALCWCFDCGVEFGRLLTELLVSERPDVMQRTAHVDSPGAVCADGGLLAWSEAVTRRAVKTLKERRHQDRRDKGC